jgi:hypothetical protein
MIGIGIGIGMTSAGFARSFCCLGGCARPLTRGYGGGGALFSAESGYCRPEETRVFWPGSEKERNFSATGSVS